MRRFAGIVAIIAVFAGFSSGWGLASPRLSRSASRRARRATMSLPAWSGSGPNAVGCRALGRFRDPPHGQIGQVWRSELPRGGREALSPGQTDIAVEEMTAWGRALH